MHFFFFSFHQKVVLPDLQTESLANIFFSKSPGKTILLLPIYSEKSRPGYWEVGRVMFYPGDAIGGKWRIQQLCGGISLSRAIGRSG